MGRVEQRWFDCAKKKCIRAGWTEAVDTPSYICHTSVGFVCIFLIRLIFEVPDKRRISRLSENQMDLHC